MDKENLKEFWQRVFRPNCYGELYSCQERIDKSCPNYKGCAAQYMKNGIKRDLREKRRKLRRLFKR